MGLLLSYVWFIYLFSGIYPVVWVVVLGILVLVRTFLSWSLVVEIEGRWPWKSAEAKSEGSGGGGETLG